MDGKPPVISTDETCYEIKMYVQIQHAIVKKTFMD